MFPFTGTVFRRDNWCPKSSRLLHFKRGASCNLMMGQFSTIKFSMLPVPPCLLYERENPAVIHKMWHLEQTTRRQSQLVKIYYSLIYKYIQVHSINRI